MPSSKTVKYLTPSIDTCDVRTMKLMANNTQQPIKASVSINPVFLNTFTASQRPFHQAFAYPYELCRCEKGDGAMKDFPHHLAHSGGTLLRFCANFYGC